MPEHPLYLPAHRQEYGYANHDFRFQAVGRVRSDGVCIVEYPRPGYDITELRTGQYNAGGRIWQDKHSLP